MTSCIRCGADVALSSNQRMFVTADGGYACPSSFPSEAAVHRVETAVHKAPRPPKPKANLGDALLGLMGIFAAYKGGEYLGRGHYGHQNETFYFDPTLTGPAADVQRARMFMLNRR